VTVTRATRTLQLRIHERETTTPADGTVEFTLAHDRLAAIPSFGGQAVRPTEGRTESTPYWIEVVDVDGEFTADLAVGGRMAMLGRILELRLATDGGAFATVDLRRLSALEGGAEGRYRLECSDERWIERRTLLFENTTSWQFDPPGRAAAWMDRPAAGERGAAAATQRYGVDAIATDFVRVWLPIPPSAVNVSETMVEVLEDDLLEEPSLAGGAFTALRFRTGGTDRPVLRFDDDPKQSLQGQLSNPLGPYLRGPGRFWSWFVVYWPSHGLANGDRITGRLYWPTGIRTTEATPYLIGGVDGIRAPALWQEIVEGQHGDPVQSHDPDAFTALAGDVYPRAWYRITAPKPRDQWVEANLAQPYAVVPFVDATGRLAPRSLRPPAAVDPDTLFTFGAATTLTPPTWHHPSGEAITVLTLNAFMWLSLLEGVSAVVPWSRRREHDTVAALGLKETTLTLDAIFRKRDIPGVFAALAADLFARFGDAPQTGECTGPIDDDAPVPGDLVGLDQDELHGPNPATGARTGTRIVHVVERQRSYEGDLAAYLYRYLDAGPAVQPLATPTVSVALNGTVPKHAVDVTVSDVPAGATATVQVAHGASPAAADWVTARTGVGNETITIPNRPSGTPINVRAFATAPQQTRSELSAVDDVTTTALTPPSSVTAIATGQSVLVEATLGETEYAVEYLVDAVSRVTLPAGSDRYTLQNLAASTEFTFGVRHRDLYGGVSSTATDTATTGTPATAPAMGALSLRAVLRQAAEQERPGPVRPTEELPETSEVPGIEISLQPGHPAFGIVVERAPDDGGSPDEPERLVAVRLAPNTRLHFDARPLDGATWWYRAFHAAEGWLDGDPTAWVSATMDPDALGDPDPDAGTIFGAQTTPAPGPQVTSATAAVEQVGTQSGGTCALPYIFRASWTVDDDTASGYVIDLDVAEDEDGVTFASLVTDLALNSSPEDEEVPGFYQTGSTDSLWRRYRVKIRRTSDDAIVSVRDSNQLTEMAEACIL